MNEEREYDVILHTTVTRMTGETVTFRDHAYSLGRNAEEAKERAVAAQKKFLPRATVVAGGCRWLRQED